MGLLNTLQIYYDDDNKATLVIKEVFPEDAGTFTCVAKNCVGYASSSAELVVQHPLSEHGSLEKHDRWVHGTIIKRRAGSMRQYFYSA